MVISDRTDRCSAQHIVSTLVWKAALFCSSAVCKALLSSYTSGLFIPRLSPGTVSVAYKKLGLIANTFACI